MISYFWRSTLAPMLASVVLSSMTSSAHAAVYSGTWDPPYGTPFTGLGWSGTVLFDVPLSPPCATSGTSCLGSGATAAYLKSAEVLFYDFSDPTHTTIASIDWTQAQLSTVQINKLLFADGTLADLATGLFPSLNPTLTAEYPAGKAFGGFASDLFALQFVVDQRVAPGSYFSGPRLYWTPSNCEHSDERRRDDDDSACRGGSNDVVNFAPQNFAIARIGSVPEPTSLALAGVALVAAAAVPSRRRKRHAENSNRTT